MTPENPASVPTTAGWRPHPRYPDPAITALDPSFDKYWLKQSAVERLYTGCRWAEGPVWFGDGRYLLWSDIPNNRMLKWEEETGVVVKYPLDVKGADILVVTPSADFFAEPHVDGLIGYGKVFHEAGVSWTLSSKASEAANFGMFIGSYENMRRVSLRIREAAMELGVKRIVFGECGHAWRVAYSFLNTLTGVGHGGEDPFAQEFQKQLDPDYPAPQHICEFTWNEIQKGTLNLDPSQNDDMVLTFHDSCNVARGSRMGDKAGGQFEIPRNVIKAVCNNYVDMSPETTREATFCCGGGGGLLTDDLMEIRVKGALPRMTALKEVVDDHGVTHMAAICAICKTQFAKVLPYYGFDMDQIISLHQLVSNAIVLTGQTSEDDEDEAEDAA